MNITPLPLIALFLLLSFQTGIAQQVGDPDFNPVIEEPHYAHDEGPAVYIDEGHNNFHTLEGRFAPFAQLLEKDGYQLSSHAKLFTDTSLQSVDILVISNALNEEDLDAWVVPNPSAFSPGEIQILTDWVHEGGALLLIADHMPFPGAAKELAHAFGFTFNNGFAIDTTRQGPIVFSKETHTLSEHAISQSIDSVASFTGQGFEIPDDAISLMNFNQDVISLMPDTAWQFHEHTPYVSLEGWSQGAVKGFGKGKIAVFGEAAMFTAQLAGPNQLKIGMNSERAPQNYRFVLNVLRWLAQT
jgi:uncharacterized protein (DUF2249 family)